MSLAENPVNATNPVHDLAAEMVGTRLLDDMRSADGPIYDHCIRTAVISREIANELYLDEAFAAQIALGAAHHDCGKALGWRQREIANSPAVFTPMTRRLMACHAPLGASMLTREMLRLRTSDTNIERAMAPHVAGIRPYAALHHRFRPEMLRTGDIDQAKTLAGIGLLQVVDVVDAITSTQAERSYLQNRSKREGTADPRVKLIRFLEAMYGTSQQDSMPFLGKDINAIAWMAYGKKSEL